MIEKTESLTGTCIVRGSGKTSLLLTIPKEIVQALNIQREDSLEVSFRKVLQRPMVLPTR